MDRGPHIGNPKNISRYIVGIEGAIMFLLNSGGSPFGVRIVAPLLSIHLKLEDA